MTTLEIISLIASIASLLLAVIAIWLSMVFYKLSSELSAKTIEDSNQISSAVEKLENLFDRLYNDTFSEMRETNSDIRKHMWSEQLIPGNDLLKEVESKTDNKIIELKKNVETELAKLLKNQQISDVKVSLLKNQMGDILNEAIDRSHMVETEAKGEKVRLIIMLMIRSWTDNNHPLKVKHLLLNLYHTYNIPRDEAIPELINMRNEGLISTTDDRFSDGAELFVNN